MSRAYDNSTRTQRAAANRDRLIEAAAALLTADQDVTIPRAAAMAGVSPATAYRAFPDAASLLEAASLQISARLGEPPAVRDLADWSAGVRARYRFFVDRVDEMRAHFRSRRLLDAHRAGRRARDRDVEALLAPLVAALPPADARAVVAVVRTIGGAETFLGVLERFGLEPDAAARALRFAQDALHEALRARAGRPWTLAAALGDDDDDGRRR